MGNREKLRSASAIILWISLAAALADGQERFQFYNTENGLPHNSVLAILQTRDGYLWFTTRGGLVRFDGVRFQVFDESNTPAIHSTNFATAILFEDRQGAIWAGSWNGAIRYHDGAFTSFTTKDGLPNNRVLRIDEDDQGNIWFFSERGLSKLHDGRLESVQTIEGEPVSRYFEPPPIVATEDHYIYGFFRLHGASGLQRFAYGKWNSIPLPIDVRHPAPDRIQLNLEDSQRRLWYSVLGRPRESFCVQNDHLSIYRGLPAGSFANYLDRFGRLWITDPNGHTALWQDGHTMPLSGLSTSSPMRILEDREGSFWVGTMNEGLAHAPPQVIRSMRLPGGPEANAIKAITQDQRGDIWIGSYGLSRLHGGRRETYFLPHSIAKWPADQVVWSLWADPDGTVFLSTSSGPRIFRHGRFDLPDRALQRITMRVNAIVRDRSGNLWLGDDAGAYIYRDSKLTPVNAQKGLQLRGEVRAVVEDKTGTVWIGTDAVLCRYRNGGLFCFGPRDPLYFWRIRSITVDRDNVVWAGTADSGLLRIEGDHLRWIQAKDGLYANNIGGILEDDNGFFWIGSRTGIFRVRRQELNALASGQIKRVNSSYFGKGDGLNSSDSGGYGQPHGLVAQDGKLWFPTTDGIATLDPAAFALDNTTPRVQIDSCFLQRQPVACREQISLPPDSPDFEITYTALNLVRSDQIQFRYRLQGLDTGWVDVGTRRTAYYSHLPPGKYRFLVTGANSLGAWNGKIRELAVTVQPHYYQTAWFRVLGLALLIGALVLIWRMRAIRYNRRQAMQRAFAQQIMASQEAERKRIAGELHDGLGQRLTVIKNMALLLNRPGARKDEQQIQAIAAETSQAIADVRQISRNLRPYQLDLLGLTKAIEALVARTCETAGILPNLVVDDLSGAFRKESEIHFYRIVQECMNNMARHSNATEVSVLAQRNGASVSLVISDNGAGFTPPRANSDDVMAGFGLTGISERARFLGGIASIRSAPGQGTTVSIDIETEELKCRDTEVKSKA